VNSIQNSDKHILLVDSGNTCPFAGKDPKARTDIIVKAMETMGYAAMNAGLNEVCCPQSILNRKLPSFPVITSNLVKKDTGKPVAEPFVIQTVGTIRIGILGIISADAFSAWDNPAYISKYEIISPEPALNRYLPELKDKTDLIILLSQCSSKVTRRIVRHLDGIHVAIANGAAGPSEHSGDGCDAEDLPVRHITADNEPVILNSGRNGTSVGYLKINFSETSDIVSYQNDTIKLDESFQETPEIKATIDSFLHDPIRLNKLRTLQNPERKNEIEALQKLSPEEYIKTLQQ